VDHYDHGFVNRPSLASQMKPLGLTAQERSDLLAFLHTLSSADEKVTLPTLPR
jgi:cytochrome c peroxidase